MNNSIILTIKNTKLSGYYFYVNLNIWGDFQICVSVPLRTNSDTVAKLSIEEISSLVNEIAVDKAVFSAWKKVGTDSKKGTEEVVKKDQKN